MKHETQLNDDIRGWYASPPDSKLLRQTDLGIASQPVRRSVTAMAA
jgi:hypothetical protein